MAGQIRVLCGNVNDRIIVKTIVRDRQSTSSIPLDSSLSRVRIERVTYGTNFSDI